MPKTKEETRACNREAQRRWRERQKAPHTPEHMPGWGHTYLLHKNGIYKIGFSNNTENRRYSLSSRHQEAISLVHSVYVRYPRIVEIEWAWRFRERRVRINTERDIPGSGEWYGLSSHDVAWICAQQGDEVLQVECTLTLEEAIEYLRQELARVSFIVVHGVSRVRVHLPDWNGYFVERDTLLEAACVARERRREIELSL